MSYSKLPKGVTDYSAGFQSVNQLADNFAQVRTMLAAEHGTREPERGIGGVLIFPRSVETLGRHATPKIPRAVVKVSPATLSFGVVGPTTFTSRPVVTGLTRLATGLYFVTLADLVDFFAECTPDGTSTSAMRVVAPRSSFGGGLPLGIGFECYEDSGTSMDLTDFAFTAHIYGTTA